MSEVEKIYNQQVDKVYKFFYIKCLDRHLAEDLTSQTFVKFVEQKTDVVRSNQVKYLYGIMRHVWMDYLRQKYRQPDMRVSFVDDFEQHVTSTINNFESTDIKSRAKKYIDLLPESQKIIANMRLLEEMTLDEIAKELNKSKVYVKTTQYRAIKSLKKLIANPFEQEVMS